MTLKISKQLLPKFIGLEGTYSNYYDAFIDEVFVSFKDPQLARFKFTANRNFVGFPYLISDVDNHTLLASLSNGNLVSIKSIVEFDELEQYKEDANTLEDMFDYVPTKLNV